MRFVLKTLKLDDREIGFESAFLELDEEVEPSSWEGFVQGADGAGLNDGAEHRVAAETTDGPFVSGRAVVSWVNTLASTFPLNGVGDLLVGDVPEVDAEAEVRDETLDEGQTLTAKRKAAVVLGIIKGETTAAEAARAIELTTAEVEQWTDRFLAGGENALRAHPEDEGPAKDEQIERLKRKVGELVLEIDMLKEPS